MNINISYGEALDRLTILEIKEKNIVEVERRKYILDELKLYDCMNVTKEKYKIFYDILYITNKLIWDLTNIIKDISYTHSDYTKISYQIFELNQTRFRMKNIINILSNSSTREQKSYKKINITFYIKEHYDNLLFDVYYGLIWNDSAKLIIGSSIHLPEYINNIVDIEINDNIETNIPIDTNSNNYKMWFKELNT